MKKSSRYGMAARAALAGVVARGGAETNPEATGTSSAPIVTTAAAHAVAAVRAPNALPLAVPAAGLLQYWNGATCS